MPSPNQAHDVRPEEPEGGCLYDGSHEPQELTSEELEAVGLAGRAAARGTGRFKIVTSIRSQNYSRTTRMQAPYGIMLHHTGGSFAGDIATLTKPASDPRKSVSSNDYVTKDGTIYELVEFPKRAWHAGSGSWNGITDGNTHFLGVEIENKGNASDPYPQKQIDAIVWRCRQRRKALGIHDPKMLTRHRDYSSQGKVDPWDNFPYAEVRKRIFAATDSTDAGGSDTDPGTDPDEPPFPAGLEKYNVAGFGLYPSLIAVAFAGALRAERTSAVSVHNSAALKVAADAAGKAPHRNGPRLVVLGGRAADALTAAGHELGSEEKSDLFGVMGKGTGPARIRSVLAGTVSLLRAVAGVEGVSAVDVEQRFRAGLVGLHENLADKLPGGIPGEDRIGPQSPLLTPARAPRAVFEDYIVGKPNGSYDDNEVRHIVGLYYETAPPVGVDPFLICVQMDHETGHLSSMWADEHHRNPAGIGVTGKEGEGVVFPDWRSAVRAHLGRILAYALTDSQANSIQRALIVEGLRWRPLPEQYRGVAPTLGALTRRWAADENYDKRIADIANALLKPWLLPADDPPQSPQPVRTLAGGHRKTSPRSSSGRAARRATPNPVSHTPTAKRQTSGTSARLRALTACLSRMRGNVHVLVLRRAGRNNAPGLPASHRRLGGRLTSRLLCPADASVRRPRDLALGPRPLRQPRTRLLARSQSGDRSSELPRGGALPAGLVVISAGLARPPSGQARLAFDVLKLREPVGWLRSCAPG